MPKGGILCTGLSWFQSPCLLSYNMCNLARGKCIPDTMLAFYKYCSAPYNYPVKSTPLGSKNHLHFTDEKAEVSPKLNHLQSQIA